MITENLTKELKMQNRLYVLPVGETISAAWQKVKGTKGPVWGAIGVLLLVSFGIGILEGVANSILPLSQSIISIIGQIIIGLMQMGILYIGIKRAFDLSVSWDMIFHAFEFNMALKILGLYLLESLIFLPIVLIFMAALFISHEAIIGGALISVGLFTIGILLCIYIAIRLYPAMAFVLDKSANPIQALKWTFKATRSNFWPLFGIFLSQILVIVLSVLTLGIAFIWSLPWIVILFGETYKRLLVNLEN